MTKMVTFRSMSAWLRHTMILMICAGMLFNAFSVHADERYENRRKDSERYDYDRHELGFHGPWHFEPHRGWRFERRPGIWSPFYVWWWLGGRVVLGLVPNETIVRYPNGYYELRGDGISVPYYWVWIPTVPASPPQPPPESVPEPAPFAPPPPPQPQGEALPPSPSSGRNEIGGTIIGGAVGGAIGSTVGRGPGRVAGVIVGTLLGALVGQNIGKSLDEADELRAAYALERNKTGQTSTWVNPDTGAQITVQPTRTFQEPSGQYCREYKTEIIVDGKKQEAYGTACRQPDGQWKIVQ
jgi:surface antigen